MNIFFTIAAVVAGAIASVAGFGIGSILTPLLAVNTGTKLAVAAVSVPHLIATALRFWMMRRHVNRRILLSFGITSAAGGLIGALLHSASTSNVLHRLLALLLIFAGGMSLLGWSQKLRFTGVMAWLAGALSGMLGGLVGNQGGIRSAAMLGLDVPRQSFVATATAIALLVDGARMPVYVFTEFHQVARLWPVMLLGTAGAVVGTIAGKKVLEGIPERIFHRVVGGLILGLGVARLAGWGS